MIRLIYFKNLRNLYNSNKNLRRRNQIILPKIILFLFQKQGSYSTVSFIPREYFSFKILKLNANELNYPARNYFIVIVFQKRRSCLIFLFKPEGFFLALILCQFWHEHLYSVSYPRDKALFDSFKVLHQVG